MASADEVGGIAVDVEVEVAFSPRPRELRRATLSLRAGSTIAEALAATGWAEFEGGPATDASLAAAGLSAAVWSAARPVSTPLRDGDRIEVLRALAVDPMDARRARYEAAGGVKALRKRRYDDQFKR